MNSVVTAAVLTVVLITGCGGSPEATKQGGVYYPPPDGQGGWRTLDSAGEVRDIVGIDRSKLDEAFEFIQGSTRNGGLLVLRRGWLAYERYFGLGHREATPNLASVGKSFTSISIGILLAERPDLFPEYLDQRIFRPAYFPPEAFPLSDPAMADIKLGQLLAFSAGIRGNNPSYVNGEEVTLDPPGPDGWQAMVDEIALGKRDGMIRGQRVTTSSLWCEPGGGYSYATASIHLASIMLGHVTGMELEDFVRGRLAEPMGWGRFGWGYQQHPEITHTPGGGGVAVRATDMLRFGYLLLRGGRWAGEQLVPLRYVRHCSRRSRYNPHYPYSLQFTVNSDGDFPGLPRDAFWKRGSGGHVIYVVPSLELVVWKLGGRNSQYDPANTGLEPPPEARAETEVRENWQQTVDPATAATQTLAMVIASMNTEQ